MSSTDLRRLAERDGITVYDAKRLAAGVWEVRLTFPRRINEPGAPTLAQFGWPHHGTQQPQADAVLAEWLNIIASKENRVFRRPVEELPAEVYLALRDDVRALLGPSYDEYMRAAGHPRKNVSTPENTGGEGCALLVIAMPTGAALTTGLALLAEHLVR